MREDEKPVTKKEMQSMVNALVFLITFVTILITFVIGDMGREILTKLG